MSTKNGLKTRQQSQNANTIVSWLEQFDFSLHNIPGVSTYSAKHVNVEDRKTSIIDLCFSRGPATSLIDT
jgi:hypothetical protein